MTTPLLFNLDSDADLAARLTDALRAETGRLNQRHFPDGESYLRIDSDCRDRDILLLCNLVNPDALTLRLIFVCQTLRELGARRIALITPYLAYMRQDRRFQQGEVINATVYGRLLSQQVDFLVCVDPHLHRIHDLAEVYQIPTKIVHSAPLIAAWLRDNCPTPLLIGPDSESEQWVAAVAEAADAPYLILTKERFGDRDVAISRPDLARWNTHTPVLVDDIISSGQTMLGALRHLQDAGMAKPICIGVHGLFADNAFADLSRLAQVVTTEAIPHASNVIPLDRALADALDAWLTDASNSIE